MAQPIESDEEYPLLPAIDTPTTPSYYKEWMEERAKLENGMDYCKHKNKNKKRDGVIKFAEKPVSLQLLELAGDAPKLIEKFRHYNPPGKGEDVTDSAECENILVPSLTFGEVLIPLAFINNARREDPYALSRKYHLLDTKTEPEDVWKLLTETWKLPHPNLVISLISGAVREESTLIPLMDALYKFCAQTGVWILSDGMHNGSSLLLSKQMGFYRESTDTDIKDVTLIGIPQWHCLDEKNKPLLHGISIEQFYDSYYFYPSQNDLKAGDVKGMANPYQHAYLFESTSDNSKESLRAKLVQHLLETKYPLGGSASDHGSYKEHKGKAFLPAVHLVIGGSISEEENILTQIEKSVEKSIPVIIASESGEVPKKIKEWFMKLEQIVPRCTVSTPAFTADEENVLKKLESSESLLKVWKNIMKHRYYLTFLDMDKTPLTHVLPTLLIEGILKGKTQKEYVSTALLTGSCDFVRATINRENDPNVEDEQEQVDGEELSKLHALNSSSNMKHIIFDEMNVKVNENNSLALVGKAIFQLMEWKYAIQYPKKNLKVGDPRTQMWHIFIYAILSNKDFETVKFLASLTKSPMGAAIFAHKLYTHLSHRARRRLEDDYVKKFESRANAFIELAEEMLKQMYATSKTEAYKSLIRTLPFDLGDDVTALSLAVDSVARKFISSSCCQTYTNMVWKGEEKKKKVIPAMPVACPVFCAQNLDGFYCAPYTKFKADLACYLGFLAVFSCFLLIDLQPWSSVSDVKATEWLTYSFAAGRILEEVLQMYATLKSYNGSTELSQEIWSRTDWFLIKTRMFKLKHYLFQGYWNTLDCLMLTLFVASTVCRFAVPYNKFQLVRIFFCVTIVFFYTRLLRYMYIFETIGPRVIAITLMLTELMKMGLVLIVFICGFGVAFQALLNPGQPASWEVLLDLLYRPYWQMYGELFLDDATSGMGRTVGNYSCTFLKENGHPDMNCFNAFPYFFVAVYLIVSNVLLLNLVIAIFGNTLSVVEKESKDHWAFQKCVLVHEYYFKMWLPSPFNLVWGLSVGLHSFVAYLYKKCKKKGSKNNTKKEHAFRLVKNPKQDKLEHRAYLKLTHARPPTY